MKQGQKQNNHRARIIPQVYTPIRSYQREQIRNTNRKIISDEFLHILAILYGSRFDEGTMMLSDVSDKTMSTMMVELQLRTALLRGQNNYKVRQEKDKNKQKEIDLLEKLKALQ